MRKKISQIKFCKKKNFAEEIFSPKQIYLPKKIVEAKQFFRRKNKSCQKKFAKIKDSEAVTMYKLKGQSYQSLNMQTGQGFK